MLHFNWPRRRVSEKALDLDFSGIPRAALLIPLLALVSACSSKPATTSPIQPVQPAPDASSQPPPAPRENPPGELKGFDLTPPEEYNRKGVLKTIHFDTDRSEIRESDKPLLDANAAWLTTHAQFNVILEGNCDERNTEEYNLALGEQRADHARAYLEGRGIPAAKIRTISYGEDRPVDPGHSETAWAKNRRVDFKLTAK